MADATARIEGVYRDHHERLWRALFAYCGDPNLASDAESEAFSQAIRRGAELRNPAAWVWRSAFKIAGGLLQARRNVPAVEVSATLAGEVSDDALVDFLSLLDGLSDQQRAIVVLRYVGRLKPAEIAESLGTTPGSVRVQLHTAHARLRPVLEAQQ